MQHICICNTYIYIYDDFRLKQSNSFLITNNKPLTIESEHSSLSSLSSSVLGTADSSDYTNDNELIVININMLDDNHYYYFEIIVTIIENISHNLA